MKEFNYKDYLQYQKWIKLEMSSGLAEDSIPYQLEKQKVNQPHDKLFKFPTVIPIVLYTGTRKWNVKKYIQECQVVTLGAKSMKFGEYNIVDVNDFTNDELETDQFFYSKMMLLEKLSKEGEIFQVLERIAENEQDEENKLLLKRTIALILKGKLSEKKIKILLEKIESEEIDMMLEVIEKGYEKQRNIGIKQGRMEGRMEGRLEGILETAKKMLKRNMAIDDIEDITGLTKKDLEKLKA